MPRRSPHTSTCCLGFSDVLHHHSFSVDRIYGNSGNGKQIGCCPDLVEISGNGSILFRRLSLFSTWKDDHWKRAREPYEILAAGNTREIVPKIIESLESHGGPIPIVKGARIGLCLLDCRDGERRSLHHL